MLKKYIIFTLILFLAISCSQDDSLKVNKELKIVSIDWLIGSWSRTNNKPGKQTFEEWSKISEKEYRGIGVTLEGSDTTFKEDLRLVYSDSKWTLEVRGVNENMTPFIFTDQSDSSFISENKKNEFPKKIIYKMNSDTLKAAISADDVSIEFNFIRNKN